MAIEQTLPASPEAERAVLGSILVDPATIITVAPLLAGPQDFFDQRHGWIYQAALGLHESGIAPDAMTIHDVLVKRGQDKEAGGLGYLAQLISETAIISHAEHYAGVVARYAIRRRIIQAAGEIAGEAYNLKSADPIGFLQRKALEVAMGRNGHTPTVRAMLGEMFEQVEAWGSDPLPLGQVRGLDLGLPSVNQLVDGLDRGLIILAGRPSMGKSSLAFELGRRVASAGKRVVLFTLEMAGDAVLHRWASGISGVETRKVKRGTCPDEYRGKQAAAGYVTPTDLGRYLKAMGEIDGYPFLHLDDAASLSAADIRLRALQQANLWGGVDLVIVDHTGYIASDERRGENSAQTEGRKSRILKQLGKSDLECTVLLVQQLNRNVEGRANKRPQLSDLRQTGEHEENADVVLGIYRDSYYLEREGKRVPDDKRHVLEVICLKNRDGPTGTKFVYYDARISRFAELERGAG